jgi:hypothetical protein
VSFSALVATEDAIKDLGVLVADCPAGPASPRQVGGRGWPRLKRSTSCSLSLVLSFTCVIGGIGALLAVAAVFFPKLNRHFDVFFCTATPEEAIASVDADLLIPAFEVLSDEVRGSSFAFVLVGNDNGNSAPGVAPPAPANATAAADVGAM